MKDFTMALIFDISEDERFAGIHDDRGIFRRGWAEHLHQDTILLLSPLCSFLAFSTMSACHTKHFHFKD